MGWDTQGYEIGFKISLDYKVLIRKLTLRIYKSKECTYINTCIKYIQRFPECLMHSAFTVLNAFLWTENINWTHFLPETRFLTSHWGPCQLTYFRRIFTMMFCYSFQITFEVSFFEDQWLDKSCPCLVRNFGQVFNTATKSYFVKVIKEVNCSVLNEKSLVE